MSHSIILQYPYETIQIALCKQGRIIQSTQFHKFKAIASTIPQIQTLLKEHNLTLSDLAFIGVNVGPGPYNTLRALLTMANGIHFAAKTPLISVNALELLQLEYEAENSIVLLHAFAENLFYRMKIGNEIKQGACSVAQVIEIIKQEESKTSMLALGNAANAHKDLLMQCCSKQLIFLDPMPQFNGLEILAQKTYEKFMQKNGDMSYVKPIYFEDLSS